jgi:hypothetical protein
MAVEMAKLSLWLITMARERPFSFLDHSICEGDSLIGISSLDQLRYLHINPEFGRAVHARTHVDATEFVQPLVEKATALRLELESLPNVSVRDAEHKQRLNDEANRLLRETAIIADGVVATAISTAMEAEQRRNVGFQGFASLIASALASRKDVQRLDAFDRLGSRNEQLLNVGRPENAPPRTPLHWPLAFPEVFKAPRHGFDAMVGNPPFLGGQRITGSFGTDYRSYLVRDIAEGRRGTADLVSYFFLRAASFANAFGFLAVNTIAQGDTREVGLDALASSGWRIVRAVRSRAWPGEAGIHISQLWLSRGSGHQRAVLDDQQVKAISPLLQAQRRVTGNPYRLIANANIAFIGSYVLGMGFTMSPEEAAHLIRKDPRNAEVLFPYLSADDVCSRPDASPSRWIVNFHDWSIERAMEYSDCFDYIAQRVKPERLAKKGVEYEQARLKWWLYLRRRPELQAAMSKLERVIVMPLTSKVMLPGLSSAKIVLDQTLVVFASDNDELFGLLSSTVHRAWARQNGGTLTTRPRYIQTDCFETFPFPTDKEKTRRITGALNECRARTMLSRSLGLTALYNRVHTEADSDPEIRVIRDLHADLDRAVCDAYGWSDLELGYGFYETDEGTRWTIGDAARNEILDRLLELNHERHHEEEERGVVAASASLNGKRTRARKAPSKRGAQMTLAENNGN